jgi:outer membrane protein insertion porin family
VALVLGLLFLSRAVTAASISELEIVTTTGDPAPLALVKANISSLEGTEFSSTALAEDIKRLYQTGFFDDVQSEVSEQPDGTYRLVVRLTPKPTIRTLSVQGNDEIKTKKLLDLVEVEEGAVLDERQVAAGVRAIIERYESKGYYGTGVRYDLAPVPESNQVDVVISVDESTRHKVRRVLFEGNTVFSDRELRKELVTKHSWFSHVFPTGYVRDAKLMEDRAILQGLYEDRGYLDFQIRELAQVPVRKGKWVEVVFQLDEGEPYTVSKLEVQGNTRFSAEELLAVVKLEEGEQHSAATETADVQAMRARYEELGYLDLFLRAERTTDPESRQVAITFRVDEGVPSTVRDIHIRGNEITKDEVIRRELAIQPGDLGDAGKVRVSRSRLENLNYFETVDITPMTTEHEDEKDLLITVTEKRTGQLMLGAGFSSEDSLVGMVEVSQGNFDWRDWPRFTGDGQRLRLRLNAGTERNEFSIDFTEPWWLDRRLRLDLELYRRERDQDEYSEEAYGGGAQVTRQLATYWRQSFGLRAKRVILDDFDAGLTP